MSYSIFRVQGVKTKGALRGLGKHHEDRISSTNNDIDPERKEANIELIGLDGKTYTEKFNDIVRPMKEEHEEHQKKQPPNRKKSFDQRIDQSNNDIAAEFLFTSDKEFFAGMTTEDIQKWGKESLDFVTEEIGLDKEKVIQAKIHMDEETPHLHVVAVPLVKAYDGRKKKDAWQISRKKFMPKREDMQRLQDKYHEKMNQAGYHLERGERKTGRKHLDVQQYKVQTNQKLEQEKEQLLQEIETIKEEKMNDHNGYLMTKNALKDIQIKKEETEKQKHQVQTEVDQLQQQKETIQKEVISAGENKKSLHASFQNEKKDLEEELNELEQRKEQSRSERLQEQEKKRELQRQVKEEEKRLEDVRELAAAKDPIEDMEFKQTITGGFMKVPGDLFQMLKERAKAFVGERQARIEAEKEKNQALKDREQMKKERDQIVNQMEQRVQQATKKSEEKAHAYMMESIQSKNVAETAKKEADAFMKKMVRDNYNEIKELRTKEDALEEVLDGVKTWSKKHFGVYITNYIAQKKEAVYRKKELSIYHHPIKEKEENDYSISLSKQSEKRISRSRDNGMEM